MNFYPQPVWHPAQAWLEMRVFAAVLAIAAAKEVEVKLLMECLWPGCQHFVDDQIGAVLADKELAAMVNFNLVPYGNAKTTAGKVLPVYVGREPSVKI